MHRPTVALLALAFLAAPLLAGCVTPGSSLDPAAIPGATVRDAVALVHKAGDNLSGRATDALVPALWPIGHDAAEPTLGITSDGHIFYAAATFENDIAGQPVPVLPRTDILRSSDGGATWEDVTPYLPGGLVRAHPETGDPYVYVDPATDRVFDIDQRLLTTCYTVTSSDDLGESWSMPPSVACMTPGLADHQTIVASKPRTLPTVGYPNVVLVCYNIVATSVCTRSLDGGATFQPAGPVGSKGVDDGRLSDLVRPNATDPLNPDVDPTVVCSAVVGHLKAASDGTVYLPRRECSEGLVFVTQDDGTTWMRVKVADGLLHGGGVVGMDPAVAVDDEGGVHYLYQAADGRLKLSSSADQGRSWGDPIDVLAPGLTAANLGAIAAAGDGSLAIAYYGSDVEGGVFAEETNASEATWSGYLAVVTGAMGDATITTTRLNPIDDPLYRGYCGVGRCGSVRDFIDVVIDADGRPWAGFVDACIEACATSAGKAEDSTSFTGMIATLASGFSLRDPSKALPPVHGAVEGHDH